jgi:hypothetical protein
MQAAADDLGLIAACLLRAADADERPTWTPGDEFADARAQ